METRVARCSCGQLSATCLSEPARGSICHCHACQRRTGSAFGLNATWPAAQVRIEGEAKSYTRSSDDGFWGRHHFCPECGTVLYWEIERRPGMVSVAVGCFADRDFPEPLVSVYQERRHPWVRVETEQPIRHE